jgi:hypothetical protein
MKSTQGAKPNKFEQTKWNWEPNQTNSIKPNGTEPNKTKWSQTNKLWVLTHQTNCEHYRDSPNKQFQMELNQTKLNQTKWNQTKLNQMELTKPNQTKQSKT